MPSLDTKDIAHTTAAELIGTYLEKGQVYFQAFMKGLGGGKKNPPSMNQLRRIKLTSSDKNQPVFALKSAESVT